MRAYAAHSGPASAQRDALINEYAEAARRISMRIARRCPDHVSRDDVVAAGMLGLAEAAQHYDAARGEPFLAFATKRIRGAVYDELRRGDIMPRRVRQTARKVGATLQRLERELGRPPEDEEVAKALGVSVEEYREELEELVHVSVGALDDAGEQHLATLDENSPEGVARKRQAMERVRPALGKLDQRDQVIIALYYNEEFSYAEIAKVLSVTPARVCQLHGKVMARLRAEIENPTTPKPSSSKPSQEVRS